MHTTWSRALLLTPILLSLLLAPPAGADAQKTPFDECGTIVEGVECVLFRVQVMDFPVEIFEHYILDDFGIYEVGSEVQVTGNFQSCFSVCQQGPGCVEVSSIVPCGTVGVEQTSFGMTKARF